MKLAALYSIGYTNTSSYCSSTTKVLAVRTEYVLLAALVHGQVLTILYSGKLWRALNLAN